MALVVALAIWAIYLVGALAGTDPNAPPNEDLWFWILVIGPCLVDLVVLVRVLRRSVGLGSLTWLARQGAALGWRLSAPDVACLRGGVPLAHSPGQGLPGR